MSTYYEVLEVSPSASHDDIHAAYRRVARAVHPDANPGPAANRRMAEVNEAWHVLGDSRRREQYDRHITVLATIIDDAPAWRAPAVPSGFDRFPHPFGWPVMSRGSLDEHNPYSHWRNADRLHRGLSLEALSGDLSSLRSVPDGDVWMLVARDRPVSDPQLRHIEHLTKLLVLDLSATDVTDAGLRSLSRMTKLDELSLNGTRVTDAGLLPLANLIKLASLDLRGTRVTAASVEHLVALQHLIVVRLPRSIDRHARRELRIALPNCEVW